MTKVRTRFAPSPTGYLHVGGLRTALYNYLFAKRHNGTFILRIEDTDQSRYVEGAAEQLMESLKWTGLNYDEGPDAGGDYGPYVQSQRTERYQAHAQTLLDNGHAYHCFCTSEDLEKMREAQMAAGAPPKYDGRCRRLSADEVESRKAAGESSVVRLKMPLEGETVFEDLVRGTVKVQNELVDDQVLLKSDGFPTYHLANVVDDHYMEISHVIRGEEWLLSVPKHLQLYKAFGWEAPKMAHLSLLLNADKTKLSKRQGDVAVEDYIGKGFLPEALLNFVATLGWSPEQDREFFTLEEMVERFDISRIGKAGAVFDLTKLNWMNGNYIRQLSEEAMTDFFLPHLASAGADISDRELSAKIIAAVHKNVSRGNEIFHAARIFYKDTLEINDPEALAHIQPDSARVVLEGFLAKAADHDTLTMADFKTIMKGVQQESGIKGQELWKPIRIALTGEISGPELPAVIEVFGKEKACSYVQQTIDRYIDK